MMVGLDGIRVLIPRPEHRSSSLVSALSAAGALAQAVPLIAIRPPINTAALDAAVLSLQAGDYAWVGFTAATAVAAVTARTAALNLTSPIPANTRCAAVGPATAAALRAAGVAVDLQPEHGGSAAGLAAVWPSAQPGQSVLLPRSDLAADTLPDALIAKGFLVDKVVAYRTVSLPVPASVAADLADGSYDAVLLTSPSTVAAIAGAPIAASVALIAIGPPTAAAATAAGLTVAVADHPTDDGLLAALAALLRTPERRSP